MAIRWRRCAFLTLPLLLGVTPSCGSSDTSNPFNVGGMGGGAGFPSTGGSATGGVSTGGLATGGVITGGVMAGGAGAATGGVATGGAQAGGIGGTASVDAGTDASTDAASSAGAGGSSGGMGAAAGSGGASGGSSLDAGGAGGAPSVDAGADVGVAPPDASGGSGGAGSPLDSGGPMVVPDALAGATLLCGDGNLVCDLYAGESCCADFQVGSGTTYSCEPAGSPLDCSSAVRTCDGASDCPGSVCCAEWLNNAFGGSRYGDFACADSCASGDTPFECRKQADCGSGEICCGDYDGFNGNYDAVTCEGTCTGQGRRILCDTADDCPDPTGYSCVQDSALPPGFGRCRAN